MADTKILTTPPTRVPAPTDELNIDVIGHDDVWTVVMTRIPGQASWDDADFVWRCVAKSPAGDRHTSLWAISGPLLASKPKSDIRFLEVLVTEYRRRFDEVRQQPAPKITIDEDAFSRAVQPAASPVERIGREIDNLIFRVVCAIPGVERFAKEGGTEIDLRLPEPEVWLLDSVVLTAIDGYMADFYAAYAQQRSRRVTPANASSAAVELRRLVRLGGVARRRIWTTTTPALEPQPAAAPAGTPRFECRESLGSGVYGEAWRARDTELNRDVVAKFIRSTGAGRREAVEAARAIARVTHPNIVVVYDVAQVSDPVTAKILDAVIMELVEGPSLLERIGKVISIDEALRIGSAILNAVAAYHEHDLVHLDFHEGNVIVGDRAVKVIDPMYFETIAIQSAATKAEMQHRELRRVRDTLAAMLRATDIDMERVMDFERANYRPVLATLRAAFHEVFHVEAAKPNEAAARVLATAVPTGFEPGPLADTARSLLLHLAAMGDGDRKGYSGLLDVTSFANEKELPLQQVRDSADLLTDQGFVTRERMNRMLMLTLTGREEAHRLGAPIASPNDDYCALLGFLASYGDGDARGATTVDDTVLGPALGFTRWRLVDAGELLRVNQTGDMVIAQGGPIRVSLGARGRQEAARLHSGVNASGRHTSR